VNPLIVAVWSLVRFFNNDIIVFCDSTKTLNFLKSRLPSNVILELFDVVYDAPRKNVKYNRFYVLDWLMGRYDKALYMDCDIFVQKNIDEIFEWNGEQILVAKDMQYDNTYDIIKNSFYKYKSSYCSAPCEYINDGIMMFNLASIDYEDMILKINELLLADPKMLDQDFTNHYFKKDLMDNKYNRTAECYYYRDMSIQDIYGHYYKMLDAHIVHYILDTKPWVDHTDDLVWDMIPLYPYVIFINSISDKLDRCFVTKCRKNADSLRNKKVDLTNRNRSNVLQLGGR